MNEYEQYNWEQTKTVRCSETRDDRRRRSNACLMGRNDLGSHVTDGRIESCRESPKRVEPVDSHHARSECIREAAVSVTRPGAWDRGKCGWLDRDTFHRLDDFWF